MPWYWYAIIVLSLGFVFASVCWYGAILGCGSAQATAEWERSKNEEKDAEIARLSALVVSKNCEIESLSECIADQDLELKHANAEVDRMNGVTEQTVQNHGKLKVEHERAQATLERIAAEFPVHILEAK